MQTSFSREPLRKTYKIETELIDEHNRRLRQGQYLYCRIVCPDCYLPAEECHHVRGENGLRHDVRIRKIGN